MKRFLTFLLTLCLLTFVGCSRYTANSFSYENWENGGAIAFEDFQGCYIFKTKANAEGSEGTIDFYLSLTDGEGVEVFYQSEIWSEKTKLVGVYAKGSAEAKRGYIERGKTVCVIVQSVGEGKISGEFSFTLTSDLSEK